LNIPEEEKKGNTFRIIESVSLYVCLKNNT